MKKSTDRALELIQMILDEAEELPERAESLAESATNFAYSVQSQVEAREFVSPKQIASLENFLNGIRKWTENS